MFMCRFHGPCFDEDHTNVDDIENEEENAYEVVHHRVSYHGWILKYNIKVA